MTRLPRFILLFALVFVALAGCGGGTDTPTSATTGVTPGSTAASTNTTASQAAQTTAASGDAPASGLGSADAPICKYVTMEQMETLFPKMTIGQPGISQSRCTIPASDGTGASNAQLDMGPPAITSPDLDQNLTSPVGPISHLDGIGERAAYATGELVFVKSGGTFVVSAKSFNVAFPAADDPVMQDTLMRIAADWANSM